MTSGEPSRPRPTGLWHKFWLASLMALLWLALALGSRAAPFLLLASAGALLLWQPLWRADVRPAARVLLVLALVVALLALPSRWPAVLWLGLVAAVLAGQAPTCVPLRRLQAASLLFVLLLWGLHGLPAALGAPLPAHTPWWSGAALLACLALIVRTPGPLPGFLQARGVLEASAVLLLLLLLSLLTATLMHQTGWPYASALAAALAGTGLVLLALTAVLGGRVRDGLSNLFARHLLAQGVPLDEWLSWLWHQQALASTPLAMLDAALARLLSTPWYAGARRAVDGQTREQGDTRGTPWSLLQEGLVLELWPSPAGQGLRAQTEQLLRALALVYHFCAAQQQQQALARLQAAHETGSRLTHDLKNLLQSLQALMALASASPEAAGPVLTAHLPLLSERIARTLDKLRGQSPLEQTLVSAPQWWQALRSRYGARDVTFSGLPSAAHTVVREAMDSVLGVLLENALEKRMADAALTVTVTWSEDDRGPSVTVCDSGAAVPTEISSRLFRLPLESPKGLGLGLYQAARTARHVGYTLTLEHNVPGQVCFRLAAGQTRSGQA